jgi:hypothetical protein
MRQFINIVENASDIIAYHGSGRRFVEFRDSSINGNFFTTDRNYAEAYAGKALSTDSKKPKNYLITVRLTVHNPLDTKNDLEAVEFYNSKFIPAINAIKRRYNLELLPEISLGKYVSFIYADDLYRYMTHYDNNAYDVLLVDEGGITNTPAIVPMSAAQIKIIKIELLK